MGIVVRGIVPFRVLYVCAANVCRSPTAALLTRRLLGPEAMASGIEVVSAGTNAADGVHWCRQAASWLSSGPDQDEFRSSHRSHRVTSEELDSADLVMTADRGVRSAIRSIRPRAAGRSFTIREAAALSATVRLQQIQRVEEPMLVDDALRWLVEEMDASRGRVRLGPLDDHPEPRGWWRRYEIHSPLDLADAHSGARVKHGPMFRELASAVRDWTGVVNELLEATTGH